MNRTDSPLIDGRPLMVATLVVLVGVVLALLAIAAMQHGASTADIVPPMM